MLSRRLLVSFLCCFFLASYGVEKKPWTFIVYIAAANSLNGFDTIDIEEMMKVGSNDTVNVLVYLTKFDDRNENKSTRLLYVEKGSVTQIGETTVEDSGSVVTLKKALRLAMTQYPADHYCIDLWNHGSGILNRDGSRAMRGICYDDDTGSYLTDRDCLNALTYAKNSLNNGKNIDVVAVDACLMNMLEFIYTLSSCTDFFVGSETTIPGDGFEYDTLLNSFVGNVPTPRAFAQAIVQTYQQEYENTPDYTLSAIDESSIQAVVDNFNQIIKVLYSALISARAALVHSALASTVAAVPWFTEKDYIDLLSFYKKLAANMYRMRLSAEDNNALYTLLKKGEQLITKAVIANVASASYKNVGGISFYFPQGAIDPSYFNLYWTEHNPNMLQLLEDYMQFG